VRVYPSDDGAAAFVSLAPGEDLMAGLNEAVGRLGMRAATIQLIGGLTESVLGYYDPAVEDYVRFSTGHVEIVSGQGNVSIKDGEPFIHLHLAVSGKDGQTKGGHAFEGCRTYVVEAYFRRLDGPAPERTDVPGLHIKAWPGTPEPA
jgi:predicted DNA-binding protein with PD1-like motif